MTSNKRQERRLWFISCRSWFPAWYQRLGWPFFGEDEYGYKILIVGFFFLGYLQLAYAKCYCEDCEEERELREVAEQYGEDMAEQVRMRRLRVRWMQEARSRDL